MRVIFWCYTLPREHQRRNARKRIQSLFRVEDVRANRINLHTFRHTFAHHMLDAGVPKEVLQTMLGHQSIKTTEMYANWMQADTLKQYLDGVDFGME